MTQGGTYFVAAVKIASEDPAAAAACGGRGTGRLAASVLSLRGAIVSFATVDDKGEFSSSDSELDDNESISWTGDVFLAFLLTCLGFGAPGLDAMVMKLKQLCRNASPWDSQGPLRFNPAIFRVLASGTDRD